jgi:hypothetical protein
VIKPETLQLVILLRHFDLRNGVEIGGGVVLRFLAASKHFKQLLLKVLELLQFVLLFSFRDFLLNLMLKLGHCLRILNVDGR